MIFATRRQAIVPYYTKRHEACDLWFLKHEDILIFEFQTLFERTSQILICSNSKCSSYHKKNSIAGFKIFYHFCEVIYRSDICFYIIRENWCAENKNFYQICEIKCKGKQLFYGLRKLLHTKISQMKKISCLGVLLKHGVWFRVCMSVMSWNYLHIILLDWHFPFSSIGIFRRNYLFVHLRSDCITLNS